VISKKTKVLICSVTGLVVILSAHMISKNRYGLGSDDGASVTSPRNPLSKTDEVDVTLPRPYEYAEETIALIQATDAEWRKPEKVAFLLPKISEAKNSLVLLTVEEERGWLLAAVAPVAARIRQLNKTPVILAVNSETAIEQVCLLERLRPVLGFAVAFGPENLLHEKITQDCPKATITAGQEPAEVGLRLARSFWSESDLSVVALVEDTEAVILGSALASNMCIPFIPITGEEASSELTEWLSSMRTEQVFLVTSDPSITGQSVKLPQQQVTILDCPAALSRIVESVGCGNVKNVVVLRVPESSEDDPSSSWLAPFLSMFHKSPVVTCNSNDPAAAEEAVRLIIERHGIKPRTVTILGDYDSIGLITARYETEVDQYEIEVEPCARPFDGMVAEVGVGRIPFARAWAASTLLARSLARDIVLQEAETRVLMIANPSTNYGPLPLCETVSRATAAEFKNAGLQIDEFYGILPSDPRVVDSAYRAHMVIYEGHISDFTLFEQPVDFEVEQYYNESEFYDPAEALVEIEELEYQQPDEPSDSDSWEPPPYVADEADVPVNADPVGVPEYTEPDSELYRPQAVETADPNRLDGLPLIVIQSCHSLDESALSLLRSGAVGVIGSVTNIHSASGSAFFKAFCNNLSYRGQTLGESLRYARNYMLCLADLKRRRGHTQQAKVVRVAHSFHLWADPEITLFNSSRPPAIFPISAHFVAPNRIVIIAPAKRLPVCQSDKYVLRAFPGTDVAGIVKSLTNRQQRRIMPIYFFKFPMPSDFISGQYDRLVAPDGTDTRSVFMTEAFERFLYVLYFPDNEKKGRQIILEFSD